MSTYLATSAVSVSTMSKWSGAESSSKAAVVSRLATVVVNKRGLSGFLCSAPLRRKANVMTEQKEANGPAVAATRVMSVYGGWGQTPAVSQSGRWCSERKNHCNYGEFHINADARQSDKLQTETLRICRSEPMSRTFILLCFKRAWQTALCFFHM